MQRAFELLGVPAQQIERLGPFDDQPRGDVAVAIDVEAHVDAAELRRIEADLEAVLAGDGMGRDFDGDAGDRHGGGGRRGSRRGGAGGCGGGGRRPCDAPAP